MNQQRHLHIYIAVLVCGLLTAPLVFTDSPASAEEEELGIFVDVDDEVKIGDNVKITALGMEPGQSYNIYFASNDVPTGDKIDDTVTSYVRLFRSVGAADETSSNPGKFQVNFDVPDILDEGEDIEDVHGGEYYIYATLRASSIIVEKTTLDIYGGEITVSPETITVGSALQITGEGLRPNQTIKIKCDGKEWEIVSGDSTTDDAGSFVCSVTIPESPTATYVVQASDVSGNKPEAEYTVEPEITTDLVAQEVDGTVNFSGTGFHIREEVIVILGNAEVITIPFDIHTTRLGSLGGSFVIPPEAPFTGGGSFNLRIYDESEALAETALTVRPILSSIKLSPATDASEPGHVGMTVTVSGIWFDADKELNITYENGDNPLTLTTESSGNRTFSLDITIPSGDPGAHEIIADDGMNQATAVFTMEGERPQPPLLLAPATSSDTTSTPSFDWTDVNDPSGISYTLQLSDDANFNQLLLEKTGLMQSEYVWDEAGKLVPSAMDSYYWRVRAVDGTMLASDWAAAASFHVTSATSGSGGNKVMYIAIGGGAAAAAAVIMARQRKTA